MKIFFGCSTARILDYADEYSAIRKFLIDEGHVITRDWLPPAIKWAKKYKTRKYDPKVVYKLVHKALNEADLIIVEDTVSNFSTGYEITFGLQRNIPVLVLWLADKKQTFKHTFLDGIDSKYLEISHYNLDNYREVLRAFINKYENSQEKSRFNLVIDEVERKYLDWAKFSKDVSRTKVIRDALRKEIDNDEEYRKYLSAEGGVVEH